MWLTFWGPHRNNTQWISCDINVSTVTKNCQRQLVDNHCPQVFGTHILWHIREGSVLNPVKCYYIHVKKKAQPPSLTACLEKRPRLEPTSAAFQDLLREKLTLGVWLVWLVLHQPHSKCQTFLCMTRPCKMTLASSTHHLQLTQSKPVPPTLPLQMSQSVPSVIFVVTRRLLLISMNKYR